MDDPELGPFPQLWTLAELLWRLLSRSGHRFLLDHDLIDGAQLHPANDDDARAAAAQLLGEGFPIGGRAPDLGALAAQAAALARPSAPVRGAMLVRAAQLVRTPSDPEPGERTFPALAVCRLSDGLLDLAAVWEKTAVACRALRIRIRIRSSSSRRRCSPSSGGRTPAATPLGVALAEERWFVKFSVERASTSESAMAWEPEPPRWPGHRQQLYPQSRRGHE